MEETGKSIQAYKNNLKGFSDKVIQILEKFRDLSDVRLNNEQLQESIQNINNVIYEAICNIKKDIEYFDANAEWNTLNIAFFGETNAGKSTLIEALIRGNGISIGEGYKDFTKDSNETRFSSNVNLLDMPGIEGSETKYVNEIKKAVEKAHVVIYVIGNNKEPEEGTVKKIKSFLKDEAKVYSVLNVRGKSSKYKDKKVLRDDNISTIEERSISKFKGILHGYYKGNVILNADLGFLSVGKWNIPPETEKEKRFEKDRVKTMTVFDSIEKVYDFSNLKAIEDTIFTLSKEGDTEIIISNTYKFLKSLEFVISKIIKEKKNFDLGKKEFQRQIEESSVRVAEISTKYQNEIFNVIEIEIYKLKNDIRDCVCKGIDNTKQETDIENEIREIRSKYEKEIIDKTKNLFNEGKKEIENLLDQFKKRISLSLKFMNLQGEIDISKIFKKIEVSFKYVLGQVADVGLSIGSIIAACAIHPIAGAFVALCVVFRKIWDWYFSDTEKRKRDAKQEAYVNIEKSINEIKNKVEIDMKDEFSKLRKHTDKLLQELPVYVSEFNCFSRSMDNKINQLKNLKVKIDMMLARYIMGDDVKIAYIDLQLEKVCIIGKHLQEINTEPFRIKDISIYDDGKNFLNNMLINTKHTISSKGELILNENIDEFAYRVLDAFKSKLGLKYIKRKIT